MFCKKSCLIAGAFIAASIFVCLRVDKQALNQPLMELLDDENKQRYMMIANERKMIYFKGFALGFILSLLALYVLNNNKFFKVTKLTNTCFVLATSFIVNYFFYILHPKSDYMVVHLDDEDQRKAWLEIYRTMQVQLSFRICLRLGRYDVRWSFLLSLIFYVVLFFYFFVFVFFYFSISSFSSFFLYSSSRTWCF